MWGWSCTLAVRQQSRELPGARLQFQKGCGGIARVVAAREHALELWMAQPMDNDEMGRPASGDAVTQGLTTPQKLIISAVWGPAKSRAFEPAANTRAQIVMPLLGTVTRALSARAVVDELDQSDTTMKTCRRCLCSSHGRHGNRTALQQPQGWNRCLPVVPSVRAHFPCPFRVIFVTCAELHSSDHRTAPYPITLLGARSSSVHIRSEAQKRRHHVSY